MKVVVKNKFWNPFFAIPRTSVFKELKSTIERELQLLVSSPFSGIKISKNRPETEARQSIELEVGKFSEYHGLTVAEISLNLSESHFDNDLIMETEFRKVIHDYNNFTGTGVYGRSFRFYVKNQYDPVPTEILRKLPVTIQDQLRNDTANEVVEDPFESYRQYFLLKSHFLRDLFAEFLVYQQGLL